MNDIKNKLESYTSEQISDIEKLIKIYDEISTDNKKLFMLTLCAYMEGIKIGQMPDDYLMEDM